MDTLNTVQDLREIFRISSDIDDQRILRHLAVASRRLRTWVGDVAYDDALSEPPTDPARAAELELAEAHLAMHFAVLGLNTALRSQGIVRSEKVEGNAVITYHSPGEIATLQQEYLDAAEAIARPYALAVDIPTAGAFIELEAV